MRHFTNFDPLAMIRPQCEQDISAILSEALTELRTINAHLEELQESSREERV